MDYNLLKLGVASLATVGLYTVLYKENKFYRFWEHVFVGLVAGYSLVALWTETLKANWWDRMVGQIHDPRGRPGEERLLDVDPPPARSA